MNVKRRTQADRTAATRAALVSAARRLFAEHGFADTATERIVHAAGVTRGALYHQFADKAELFAAVFEDVEIDVSNRLIAALTKAGSADLAVGADAWLDVCTEPEVVQIVLVDGPSVLGWERWREIGMRYGLGLVSGALTEAVQEGKIAKQPIAPLAHVLVGALDEAAFYVSRAADPAKARRDVKRVVRRILAAFAAEPVAGPAGLPTATAGTGAAGRRPARAARGR